MCLAIIDAAPTTIYITSAFLYDLTSNAYLVFINSSTNFLLNIFGPSKIIVQLLLPIAVIMFLALSLSKLLYPLSLTYLSISSASAICIL